MYPDTMFHGTEIEDNSSVFGSSTSQGTSILPMPALQRLTAPEVLWHTAMQLIQNPTQTWMNLGSGTPYEHMICGEVLLQLLQRQNANMTSEDASNIGPWLRINEVAGRSNSVAPTYDCMSITSSETRGLSRSERKTRNKRDLSSC